MKGAQSSISNASSPFLIRRSLGPEESDFKLWIVKLQRKELEATQNLQFRAPRCLWELDYLLQNRVVVVSSFPPGKSSKLFRCEG